MNDLFWRIVNIGISASWLILAVIVFRFVLKKAPKALHVAMWALVALRLICPVTIESELSLVPQHEISQQAIESWTGERDTPAVSFDPVHQEIQDNTTQMPDIPVKIASAPDISYTNENVTVIIPETESKTPVKTWNALDILPFVWLSGFALMLLYSVTGYLRLSRKLRTAVIMEKNIYCTEYSGAPFVFGILKPKIYIPYNMQLRDMGYVIAHEKVHIHRKDHWWKPIGYVLLCLYWFNPLMWLAYSLLCKDIELACDERVVKGYDHEQRADYSQALLACSANRIKMLACPVAFGETGTRERIKNVLRYKKPTIWITVIAVVAIAVCGICFMTAQPAEAIQPDNTSSNHVFGDAAQGKSLSKTNGDAVMNDEPVIQYFPNGVAYSIKALDVKSSYISLEIMAYLENGEQLQMYHIPHYWLEEKTDAGWDPLPVKDPEVQWSQTLIHLTGCTSTDGVKGCDYMWPAEWSDLYGLLPVGSYRIGIRVTEDAEPYYVEFSLEESNNEQISKELEYCRQVVQKILDSNYYQVMIEQNSELLSIAPNSGNEHLLGNPTVMHQTIIKSGEDYLEYQLVDQNGNYAPRDGSMRKHGITYRADNVVEWDPTSGIAGWSVWTEPRQDLFTWWADCFALNAQHIDDIRVEENTITFCTAEGPETERTETECAFIFNGSGALEKMCRTTRMNNYNGFEAEHVSVSEVTILSVNDPQVSEWIDEQDVNFYRDFSWSADVSKYGLSGTVLKENTSVQSVTTAPEAIAAAEKYSDGDYTKIVVYRDEASGMWKVEFQRNYGARGYAYVYLDGTGNYYGHAEGDRRT